MKNLFKLLFFLFILSCMFSSTPKNVEIVNVTDKAFTVVWYTDDSVEGYIEWGTSNINQTVYDVRGQNKSDKVHFVELNNEDNGIESNTNYIFRIISDGQAYNNSNGDYFSFNTPAPFTFPSFGRERNINNVYAFNSNNLVSSSEDIIVFARVLDDNGNYSQSQAILYYNGFNPTHPYYKKVFFLDDSFITSQNSYIKYSNIQQVEFLSWTSNDGFGGWITVNKTADNIDIRLNTTNIISFDDVTSSDISTPTPTTTNISINTILYYSNNNQNFQQLLANTILSENIIIVATVNSSVITDNQDITLKVFSNGVLIAQDTFSPTKNEIVRYISVNLYNGNNDLQLYANDWNNSTSNILDRTVFAISDSSFDERKLEDFEVRANVKNFFGDYNYLYESHGVNGSTSVLLDGANGTNRSQKINYNLQNPDSNGFYYVGYGLNLTKNTAEENLSSYNAVRFFAKGTGQIAVELEATNDIISDSNHFYKVITIDNNWKEYVISLSTFVQNDWGQTVDLKEAMKRMRAIKLKAYPQTQGATGWYQIDEISFIRGEIGDVPTVNTSNPVNPPVVNKGVTINNFNAGLVTAWGGYTYAYNDNDAPNNGNSIVSINIINDANLNSQVLSVSYEILGAYNDPFVGVGLGLNPSDQIVENISQFSGITFRAKGLVTLDVEVKSSIVTDHGQFFTRVTIDSNNWNTYTVSFKDFVQESWAVKHSLLDVLENALAVQLKIGETNRKGDLYIEDIKFYYNNPEPVKTFNASARDSIATLEWEKAVGATSYLVVRNVATYPSPGNFPTSISEGESFLVTDNSFTQTLEDNKTYFYAVFAYNHITSQYSLVGKKANSSISNRGLISLVSNIVTLDSTVDYLEGSRPSQSIFLRNGDFVKTTFNVRVTVNTTMPTTSALITLYLFDDNTTINQVTFAPTSNQNVFEFSVTLNEGAKQLSFIAVDWNSDSTLALQRDITVAGESTKVGLVPGKPVLTAPHIFNPLNGDLTIAYELTVEADVELYVYNLLGQVVWRNKYFKGFDGARTGYNSVIFNGTDAFNTKLSVGLYFVQIVHGNNVLGTGKFLVTR
jgi:hypothetical protein